MNPVSYENRPVFVQTKRESINNWIAPFDDVPKQTADDSPWSDGNISGIGVKHVV
jgi:hypothetical protein